VTATGDTDLAAALVDGLDDVVHRHVQGTRYGIRIEPDGLLTQGADGHALTWMDAVVHGEPATPRRGKAVELNALWINALAALAALRNRLRRDATDLGRAPFAGGAVLPGAVPVPPGLALRHSGRSAGDDASLRPNQLLAYGLPYAPLREARIRPRCTPWPVRCSPRWACVPSPGFAGVRRAAPGRPGGPGPRLPPGDGRGRG
jgi:predicted glycogen debranching enzyme